MADFLRALVSACFSLAVCVNAQGYDPELGEYQSLYSDYPEYFDGSNPSSDYVPYVNEHGVFDVNMTMPGVRPPKPDTYYCYTMPVSDQMPVFVVGYEPLVQKNTAHHMLLFGCSVPGGTYDIWNCGEMEGDGGGNPPCLMGEKILYAWAMDAPSLKLPKGVGFEVGGDTSINYLVLQVHYSQIDKFKDGVLDYTGVGLQMTFKPQEHVAGVYFMVTNNGRIEPNEETHLEAACAYKGSPVLYPFAYRVHTHKLGKVVSGYRIRDDEWEEIGKRDPQLPQMFFPISKPGFTIEKGDTLAMRCTYESSRKEDTFIGPTTQDEMCNFYMMFFTKREPLPISDTCVTYNYHWADNLRNIPDELASTLPAEGAAEDARDTTDEEANDTTDEEAKDTKEEKDDAEVVKVDEKVDGSNLSGEDEDKKNAE